MTTTSPDRAVRQRDLVPPVALADYHVLVVGVGAIGRQVALQLAAMGTSAMTLVDDDAVAIENLAVQGFSPHEIGLAKVEAVATSCRTLLPDVELDARQERFTRASQHALPCLTHRQRPKLAVFACVDSMGGRRILFKTVRHHAGLLVDGRMAGETLRVGTLVTTRVTHHSEQSEACIGYLGAMTITWQGTGSVLLGPDLRSAQITDRDDTGRTATIRIPRPIVLEQALDLSTSRLTIDVEGLGQIAPDRRLITVGQRRLLRQAQTTLVNGITSDHYAAARSSAEATLQQFGHSLGWTIRVQWQDLPGRRSLRGEWRPGGLFV